VVHFASKERATLGVSVRKAGPAMSRGLWQSVALGAAAPVGAWVQLQQAALWPGAVYTGWAVGLLGVAVWAWRRGRALGWLAPLLLCALAFAWVGGRATWHAQHGLPAALEAQPLQLTGLVASLPRASAGGMQTEFRIEQGWHEGQPVALPPRIQLAWPAGLSPRAGERWVLQARLHQPHGLSNPHGFDTELWFWERGLQASGRVLSNDRQPPPQRLVQTAWYPVEQARQSVRERLWRSVPDARQAGLLIALLAGDQASIQPADWDTFRRTGIAHLVSVSGVHVTMFAWLAVLVVGASWRALGRWSPGLLWRVPVPVAASVGGVLLAALYAWFSGWGVPSQRTVLMLATVVLLRLGGRRWPWPVVWLGAMNAVVWTDPWALLQPGFWLSFVAVGVLFATASPWSGQPSTWRQRLHDLWRTQAIVTVALAPLTLLLFGQFSLVSLLANLWAIPWVTLVVTPLAMLGVALPGLWTLGGWAAEALYWGLELMAVWPWAVVERPALPTALALLAVLGGVMLVWPWPWGLRAWGLVLLWPALTFQPPRPAEGHYELWAADVGQGSAVLLRTARHTLLFDTGPPMGAQSDSAERVLIPHLRALGDRPDAIVVSHADSDHASGMARLAAAYPRAAWWTSFDAPPPVGPLAQTCEAGRGWVWDGVPFRFLHPRGDADRHLSDNARSCVLQVGEGDRVAVLTGDITVAEENRLAFDHPALRAAVLMSPHHGSKTSSGPVWLNVLQPRQIIVQVAHRSRYGHPSPVVLQRYEARGIPWVASPACGAATWLSQQPGQIGCHRQAALRYWHHRAGHRASDPGQ
jgi:competence protein ComEC